MEKSLTTEQMESVMAAIGTGFELDEFAGRHPEYPQEALTDFWERLSVEMKATKLEPGQYWGIPSEWA